MSEGGFFRNEARRFRDAAASAQDNDDRSIHSKIDCGDKLDGIADRVQAGDDNDGCFSVVPVFIFVLFLISEMLARGV